MKQRILLSTIIILSVATFSANAVDRPETDYYLYFSENHGNKTAKITGYYGESRIPYHLILPDYHIPTVNEVRYKVIGFYGNGVFRGFSKIRSVAIPSTYQNIPSTTFIDCENLTGFSWTRGQSEGRGEYYYIQNGILYLGADMSQMFCYPAGKVESEFQVPSKCYSIGVYCFYKQRHIKNVVFHNKLKDIGDYAFWGCDKLISVNIPSSVKKIGVSAFESCSSLETVTIPASIKEISKNSFANCPNLKTITIEDGVEKIGQKSFANCVSLETIVIPASVTQIDACAFSGCSNLKTIIFQSGIRAFGTDVFSGCNSISEVRIVDLSGWCQSDFETSLSNPVYIAKRLNYIGNNITELVIPSTVSKIGKNAFYGHTQLTSITFNDNVSTISQDAFADCENIGRVNIPNLSFWCNINFASDNSNPLKFSKGLFINNEKISILDIPEDVSLIKKYAFFNGDFSQIWLPASINEISDASFKGTRPSSIRCNSKTPPAIANTSFSDYSAILYVPSESKVSYWSHNVWGLFSQIEEMPIDAISISFDRSEHKLYVNDTLTLKVFYNPAETTDRNLTWTSSDDSVASVKDGVVTALKKGNATITAKTANNIGATCQIIVNEMYANAITVNPQKLSLTHGASAKLIATLLPANTTNKAVIWASENEAIASVSQDGVVKALSEGTTQISATTMDGTNLSAICQLTVSPKLVSSISLSTSRLEGYEGENLHIEAYVIPEDATNKILAWSSSNESVATVDGTGEISLLKEGTAVITVSATDESGVTATCNVSVLKPEVLVSAISLNPLSAEGKEGDQIQINATVIPEDATNKILAWSSSDESVATVDGNGKVSLLKEGTATVTASATDESGVTATCNMSVRNPLVLVSSISLDPTSVERKEGDQVQINATVLPEDATNKTISWSSSDESIAIVDGSGLISLLKRGTAIITASATDGSSVAAECAVFVTGSSRIEDILTEKNTYVKIFNLRGVLVYEGIYSEANLVPNYYIVVCDGKNVKVKVE